VKLFIAKFQTPARTELERVFVDKVAKPVKVAKAPKRQAGPRPKPAQ
jgi:hypothetical protein